MVEPNVYGVWEEIESGYQKETDSARYVVEVVSEDEVYCFVEFDDGQTIEYEKQVAAYIDDLCKEIMRRESHGDGIIDVLENMGFEKV